MESVDWLNPDLAKPRSDTAPEAPPALAHDDAEGFAVHAARIAAGNRIENVVVLDLRGLSTLADYFVIGTGTSNRQMHAVLDDIRVFAKRVGRRHFSSADTATSTTWVLADYVDVVIHLFDDDHRDYYDLEGLWGDAKSVRWEPENTDTGNNP
ncbi:MAG: ribosome silencing factor [Phycisphaerales bacterium]|nr:ribosome silencing factor [Phycisphaerales bacterium]